MLVTGSYCLRIMLDHVTNLAQINNFKYKHSKIAVPPPRERHSVFDAEGKKTTNDNKMNYSRYAKSSE